MSQFTYTPKVRNELKKIIYHGCNWFSSPSEIECYNRGLSILDIAKDSNSMHEIDEIQRELMEHLKRSNFNVDVLFLTFSAKVFFVLSEFRDRGKERLNLESSITKCIETINLDENDDKLTKILEKSSNVFLPLGQYAEWKLKKLGQHLHQKPNEMTEKLVRIMIDLCGFNWANLIEIYKPLNCLGQLHCLSKILDNRSFSSWVLCAQPTLASFCDKYENLRKTVNRTSKQVNAPISVHQEVAKKLCSILKIQKKIEPRLLTDIIKCIDGLRFEKNEAAHRNIIDALIRPLQNDLDKIESLWQKIYVDHSDYQMVRDKISSKLSYLFGQQNNFHYILIPSVKEFVKVHQSTLRYLISYRDTCVYLERMMEWHCDESEDILMALDLVYKNFVQTDESVSSFILSCLKQYLTFRPHRFIELFRFVSANAEMFCIDDYDNDEFFKSIATLTIEIWNIEQNSDLLKELPESKHTGILLNHLLNKLQISLNSYYDDIEMAIGIYSEYAMESIEPMKTILDKVMKNAIDMWHPTSVIDLMRLESSSLFLLERFLDASNKSDIASNKSDIIRKICKCWLRNFNSNNVTPQMINKVLHRCNGEKLKALRSITEVEQVSENKLSETRNEINNLKSSIQTDCSINISRGTKSKRQLLLDVFERFECNIKSETCDVASLLFKCKKFELANFSTEAESLTISEIQLIAKDIRRFRHKFDNQIKTLSYFLGVDCKLFNNELDAGVPESPISIEDFLDVIKQVELELLTIIRCNGNTPFSLVKKASSLIFEDQQDLKYNVRLLARCPTFDISDLDLENFFFLSSMVNLVTQLESFVRLCQQFQFQIIKDSNFNLLSAVSLRIVSNDALVWSLCEWKKTFSELSKLLYSYESNLDSHEDIEDLYDVLMTLNLLSRHADIWKFIGEMKWFGVEGLKQFYKEYSNVTNQLLFASRESFESNILDTLEPTVRLLSFVGDLSKCFWKDFFKGIRRRNNIGLYKPDEMQRNLKIIQQNLTSIQEWFDGGVDEMIATFSRFNLAWKCGKYTICDNRLSLTYQSHEKEDCLSGSILDEFVQQLGFVKHENPEISAKISSFIDQFCLIEKIVQIKIEVAKVGYRKTSLDSFSYTIDQDAKIATDLLKETNIIHQQCNTWLKEIRMNNPLLALLSTEDLRRIYNAMNEKDVNVILLGLSPLIPPHTIMTTYENAYRIIQEYIDDNLNRIDTLSEKSWIEVVSLFIERWHDNMKEPRSLTNLKKIKSRNVMFLHSFDCNEDKKSILYLAAMRYIFKVNLSEIFLFMK